MTTARPPAPLPSPDANADAEPRAMRKIQAHFQKIQQILRSLKGDADADRATVRARFAHHLQRIWGLLSDLPLVILDDGGKLCPLLTPHDQPLSPLHPFDRVRLTHLSLSAGAPTDADAPTPPRLPDLSDLRAWAFDDLMSLLQALMVAVQQSLDQTARLNRALRRDPAAAPALLPLLPLIANSDATRARLVALLADPDAPLPAPPAGEKPN